MRQIHVYIVLIQLNIRDTLLNGKFFKVPSVLQYYILQILFVVNVF